LIWRSKEVSILSIWAGVLTTTTGFDLSGFHFTEREEAMTEYTGFSF